MNEVLFDIVFKGRFVNSIEKDKAVENFSKLFKLPFDKAEKFFDGKPRTLKKSLNMEKASHFRAALKKAGIRVSLDKIEDTTPQNEELTLAEPGVVIVNKPFTSPKVFDVKQFSLDAVGATLVTYTPVESKKFDLSHFQIDEVGSIMADKQIIPEPEFDLSDLTMDEVGSIMEEKVEVEAPKFNLDGLDLEAVGEVLPQPEKPQKPSFDIGDISLAD